MTKRLETDGYSQIDSDLLRHVLTEGYQPGDRLPSLNDFSQQVGVSVGKLREQLEVCACSGLVEASPRRGITRTEYAFQPAVRLSLLTAMALDAHAFDQFSSLRGHLEYAYWDEAVACDGAVEHLRQLVAEAKVMLNQPRIQIPFREHREFHLSIFKRLENPFVVGLLEAYWDAYEAVELNTYADYPYLQEVWAYHERITEAICAGDIEGSKQLLIEHMQLLSRRGISVEGSTASLPVGPHSKAPWDSLEVIIQGGFETITLTMRKACGLRYRFSTA